MQRILIYLIMSFLTFTTYAQYVDLGLPSGTKWKNQNESGGFYKYEEAVRKFGDKLPTKQQFEELKRYCSWDWTGKGYKVTGPNGNYIILPASGYCDLLGDTYDAGKLGYYWSSTPMRDTTKGAFDFCFNSKFIEISPSFYLFKESVRLVQD